MKKKKHTARSLALFEINHQRLSAWEERHKLLYAGELWNREKYALVGHTAMSLADVINIHYFSVVYRNTPVADNIG